MVFYAPPWVRVGTREFEAQLPWDLPSLASGAAALTDVMVTGFRQWRPAQAWLVNSARIIDLTAFGWTNNTVGRDGSKYLTDHIPSGGDDAVYAVGEAKRGVRRQTASVQLHTPQPQRISHHTD